MQIHVHSCIQMHILLQLVKSHRFNSLYIPLHKHTHSVWKMSEETCVLRVVVLLLGGNREQVVLVGSQNHLI